LGRAKAQLVPHSTVWLFAHVISGGAVSITVTVWLHMARLVQKSVASHVRVALKVIPQVALVTVLTTTTVTFVPSQASAALGRSKLQAVPHSIVLDEPQTSSGSVVSTTVTVWLHVARLVQESIASQVRVALSVFPQNPIRLVVVLMTLTVTFVPSALSFTDGAAKAQAVPHSTT
jgi:predicted XRE-type DNA-binding protein